MKLSTSSLSHQAIDAAIKIGVIFTLVYWCFEILRPFVVLVVWGAVIATALFPIAVSLSKRTGLSEGKAGFLLVFIGILVLVVPTYLTSGAAIAEAQYIYDGVHNGTLKIPPPNPSVQEWPFVGDKVHAFLTTTSGDLESAIVTYQDQLKELVAIGLATVGGLLGSILKFVFSFLIAGAFMSNAQACERVFHSISVRLAGDMGSSMSALTVSTVRSVVQGVLGVAVIQSIMAGLGLFIAGVPMVGLWMLGVLLIAIVQLPPIIALIPPIIIAYTGESSFVATALLVWCLIVSASDAVLKPMLLGRGSDVPMLVILLGAIGGMAMSGIIGLFVGAVVLAVTHNLFMAWLHQLEEQDEQKQIQSKEGSSEAAE